MSDRDSSPSKHVLNATLLEKGNTVTAILSSGRQLLSLPIPPQVQYHESVMSALAQWDHLKCIWNLKSPNQLTEHQLKRAEIDKLLDIPIQLICMMQHDNAFVFCSCKQTSHIDSLCWGYFQNQLTSLILKDIRISKMKVSLICKVLLFELIRIHTWKEQFWMRLNGYISGFLMKFFVQTSQG
jgi:hypothetical protein